MVHAERRQGVRVQIPLSLRRHGESESGQTHRKLGKFLNPRRQTMAAKKAKTSAKAEVQPVKKGR